jgi:hypothetical protein
MALPVSDVDARLQFAKCSSLSISLADSGGTTVASASGPSVVVLDADVPGGTYIYTVAGSTRCSFTLTIIVAP